MSLGSKNPDLRMSTGFLERCLLMEGVIETQAPEVGGAELPLLPPFLSESCSIVSFIFTPTLDTQTVPIAAKLF
jgi:hypothetical protein